MIKPGKMLRQVLMSLFKVPATTGYPFIKKEMPDRFRGKLKFYPDKCIACKLCMKDCPSGAIVITKLEGGKIEAAINLARCIYCAQCVDTCPKGALEATREFELAKIDKAELKVVFRAADGPDAKKPA